MPKRVNVHETSGDGAILVRNYDQGIQYRTFRATVTPATCPDNVRASYRIDRPMVVKALVRFDDECRNGHCTLSVTGDLMEWDKRRDPIRAGGCIHDLVAIAFPQLTRAIQYHLVSTDCPLHYPANPLYLAGDRDYNGRRAGDPSAWSHGVRFGNSPVTHVLKRAFSEFLQAQPGTGTFTVCPIAYVPREDDTSTYKFAPKWTVTGYADKWYECPFDSESEAREFCLALNTCCPVEYVKIVTGYSDGKARDLDGARATAIWPDATDAELSADTDVLKAALLARLPTLMADFRAVVEELGFDYDFPAKGRAK
jgi:hypothetical protein